MDYGLWTTIQVTDYGLRTNYTLPTTMRTVRFKYDYILSELPCATEDALPLVDADDDLEASY